MLPYDDHRLLVGTRRDGIFLYDGAALTPFATEVDPVFKSTQIYRGLVLPGPSIAIETTSAGLIILDMNGHHLMTVDRSNGLPSDTVYYALRDREGALWLGQDAGVARVEIPSPVTYFNQSDGLSGGVQTASRIDGRLLVGLQSGAAYLAPGSPDGKTPPHFENILGTGTQCWWFTKMVDPAQQAEAPSCSRAATGSTRSSATPSARSRQPADLSFRPNVLVVSKHDPSRVWAGLFDGLASFRWVGGKWIDEGRVEGAGYETRSLFEETNGVLWMGTSNDGVVQVTLGPRPPRRASGRPTHVDHFTEKDGLPKGAVTVTDVDGVPIFTGGIDDPRAMRFDASTGRFIRDTAFDNVVGVNLNVTGGFFVATLRDASSSIWAARRL